MTDEPREHSLISFRTALLLFILLLAAAAVLLKGNIRIVMVLVILGLIAKSVVHHFRTRLE